MIPRLTDATIECALVAWVIAGLLTLTCVTGCDSARKNAQANKTAAQTVVSALKNYKAATGRFPPSLQQLIPKYLPSLPKLSGSTTWSYQVEPDGANFILTYVGYSSDWTGSYWSSSDTWGVDDK
jgi:hypothetical protein